MFKCKNFQKMGAFKMRGAINAIMQLNEKQRSRGVVTHSSGNFAQAVSLSAKSLGVKAYIDMSKNATKVKKDAVLGYGGIITECKPTIFAREKASNKIINETGAAFIHPSNDMDVIIGNSTACFELLQGHLDLETIITPIGGGGLIASTALASHYFSKNCKVIGAEPLEADDAYRPLISGEIETNKTSKTLADGLRTHLGDINFPIIQNHVERIIRVTEIEIKEALRLIYERLKIVVESSIAVALAAVIKEKNTFENKKIGIILSGGNIDLDNCILIFQLILSKHKA